MYVAESQIIFKGDKLNTTQICKQKEEVIVSSLVNLHYNISMT
jgi:hypothetical protein